MGMLWIPEETIYLSHPDQPIMSMKCTVSWLWLRPRSHNYGILSDIKQLSNGGCDYDSYYCESDLHI